MNFEELYQEIVLDHSRRPRNFGTLTDATVTAEGRNPTCGDEITLQLKLEGGQIEEARFTGQGCAICMASASLMTRAIRQHPEEFARDVFERFHQAIEGGAESERPLGDLAALAGVRQFPQRVKCAMLPWQTLNQALDQHSHEN
jgi:nitrogen fixation NifU-like protein